MKFLVLHNEGCFETGIFLNNVQYFHMNIIRIKDIHGKEILPLEAWKRRAKLKEAIISLQSCGKRDLKKINERFTKWGFILEKIDERGDKGDESE